MQPVRWRAAACPATGEWLPTAHAAVRKPSGYRSAGSCGGRACVARRVADECPLSRFVERLPAFLQTRPRSWFFCGRAARLGPRPKRSPGVVALEPGATMHASVDTRLHADAAEAAAGDAAGGGANASAAVHLALEHLTSYEGMGTVELRCLGGCTCPPQRVDAHRPAASHGRVSVYAVHHFLVAAGAGAGAGCALLQAVLRHGDIREVLFSVQRNILPEHHQGVH